MIAENRSHMITHSKIVDRSHIHCAPPHEEAGLEINTTYPQLGQTKKAPR